MSLSKRSLYLFILPFLIATFSVPCSGTARATSLSIHVQGDLVDIQAEEVPLIDVIKAICEKTGITLKSSDPMIERVSLNLTETPVEKCLRRLLSKRNYALVYETTGDNQLVSVSLRILGSGPAVLVEPETPAPPPNDPFKRYEKKSFSRMFGNSKKLSKQISAKAAKGDWPDGGGITLTRVSQQSALAKIGLEKGDIVRDVNGEEVRSTEELIGALQKPARDQAMIRIERLRQNGEMDPIYIELQ
jgi:hypothetical protein